MEQEGNKPCEIDGTSGRRARGEAGTGNELWAGPRPPPVSSVSAEAARPRVRVGLHPGSFLAVIHALSTVDVGGRSVRRDPSHQLPAFSEVP